MTSYYCKECKTTWIKGSVQPKKDGMCTDCFTDKFHKKEPSLVRNWDIIDLEGAEKVE